MAQYATMGKSGEAQIEQNQPPGDDRHGTYKIGMAKMLKGGVIMGHRL